mmetsp:Transcript_79480/g.199813  ORF Transcript_79480/g.199813 Transcript_79480/m.199813 type:complete len:293 (-) Transcript_79480:307-1185(-)
MWRSPTFDAVLGGDFADGLLMPFLSLSEISKLESSHRYARRVLLSGSSWTMCACRELLPRFVMECPSAALRGSREDLRGLVSSLRTAKTALGSPPIVVSGLGMGQRLSAAVNRARTSAARHLAAGGSFAEVVVTTFRFPSATSDSAASRAPDSDIIISSRAAVAVGGVQQVWELKLAWQAGSMHLGARPRRRAAQPAPVTDDADEPPFVVDVHSVSDHLMLRLLDVPMQAHLGWVKGKGLCSVPFSRAGAMDALAAGLTCVLLLRDAKSVKLSSQSAFGVDAMNLDAPRRAW